MFGPVRRRPLVPLGSAAAAMPSWTAGAVFAVFWIVLWLPIFACAMFAFYTNKDVQPIKARSPMLVIVTDIVRLHTTCATERSAEGRQGRESEGNKSFHWLTPQRVTVVNVRPQILLLYTISLCFQRIVESDYPCLLNVWSGYAGTIVLFNSYLWRCQSDRAAQCYAGERGSESDHHGRERSPSTLNRLWGVVCVVRSFALCACGCVCC